MYQNILVAVDDSETSCQALEEAIKLVKNQRGKLRIMHVADEAFIDYVGLEINYAEYAAAIKEAGEKLLVKMLKIAEHAHINCDTQLVELKAFQGRVEQKIIESAKTWPADLLVIGTHGRRGFRHLLLGSIAEGVVRIAPIPVLLIRAKSA